LKTRHPSSSYELPQLAEVELIVVDISCREIQKLVNRVQPAGRHTVKFDGQGLPSGVYLYRLRVGSHVATKKLVLTK